MKRVLTGLVTLILVLSPHGVFGKTQEKVFASYSLSGSNGNLRQLVEVKPGEELLQGNYSVKAKLSLKNKKHKVIQDSFNFDWPAQERPSNTIFRQGWTSLRKTFYWNPDNGKEGSTLSIPLTPRATGTEISTPDLNELHFDYQDIFDDNPATFNVQMAVSGEKHGKTTYILAYAGMENLLTPFETLNIVPNTWGKKDNFYLAKRILGLPFDRTWRYARSGENTVFQRRFHLDLNFYETLDFVMKEGTTAKQIESLTCNIRIGFENWLKPTQFLTWPHIPKQIININGQKILRVHIGQYARGLYENLKGIYMEEMIFFLPGTTTEVTSNPLLEKITIQAPGEFELKPVEALNVKSERWEKKDFSYTIDKILGRPIDTTWRYSSDNSKTLLHRRFNKDLTAIEAMDFAFSPEIDATQVNLTLRIGQKTIEWKELPRRLLKVKERDILRIKIGELIRNNFSKKEKNNLKEIVISVPQKMGTVARNKPMKEIIFLSHEVYENDTIAKNPVSTRSIDDVLHLSSRIEHLTQNRKRLVIDMRELQKKLNWDAKIHSMVLITRPQNPESPAAFDLESVRVASPLEEERPLFIDAKKQMLSKWGGPFLNPGDEHQSIEWPRVHAYLSFKKGEQKGLPFIFDKNQNKTIGIQPGNENPDGLQNLSMDKNIDSLVRFRGATVHAHPHLSSWSSESDGLTLEGEGEGEGKWIEINWPVQIKLKNSARFFLGISEGAKTIRSMQITPFSRGRPLKQIQAFPNLPRYLDVANGEIDGFKIHMLLHKNSFKLKLDEMVVFQSIAVSPAQALDIPIPLWNETPLIPKDIKSLPGTQISVNQGNLRAIIFPETNTLNTFTWTTDINRNVDGIERIKINYQAPSTIIATHPCWLELTLVSPEHEAKKTVCPKLSSGQIIIPAYDLFHGSEMPSDDVIKFITWKISFKDPTDSKQPLVFGMTVTLEGVKFLPLKQELIQHSVLEWQGQKIFPTFLADRSSADLLSGQNVVKLGNLSINDASEANLNLKFSNHPYIDVHSVVFEKLEPIAPKLLASFWAPFIEKNPPVIQLLPKFLPLLITSALLWWGWKRGWHKFIWKWRKSWWGLFWGKIKPLSQRFPRLIQNADKGFLFNRILGLVLLVPGLLIVGRLIERNIGKFALGGIIVLLIGVLWHELRCWLSASPKADDISQSNHRGENGSLFKNWIFGVNKQFPPFLYLVAAMGLSWISFSLGHGNDLALSFLPPLGLIYFYIPWLTELFKGKLRFWLTTATGLYLLGVIGLLIKWKGGADFFFILAGIAVVLVWRNLIPHIRPRLEPRWPNFADKVFGGAGTPYLAGFLLTLLVSIIFLIIRLKPVAEQIAVVGYYMLVVGVFLEIRNLRNKNQNPGKEDEVISTGEYTSRA
jgi:hypothetical protein